MRNATKRGTAFVACTAVSVLALGGVGGAWAGAGGANIRSGSHPRQVVQASVSGTVTSTTANSFVVTLPGGTTVTVATTVNTVFAETGAVVAPIGVSVGDQVAVTPTTGTSPTATTIDAVRVLIVLVHVIGTVQSVGAASFTVQLQGGLIVTVQTTATTKYRMGGVTQSGISIGQTVTAYGATAPTDPATLDAQFVVVSSPTPNSVAPTTGGGNSSGQEQLLSGSVTAVGASSFDLSEAGGVIITVDTTAATTYGETGSPTAPIGVVTGEQVRVTPAAATVAGATTVTAARVVVVLTQLTGTVVAVGTGSMTIQLFGGLVLTVTTSGSTVFTQGGAVVTGVTAGQKVTAYGSPDPGNPAQLDAQFVAVDTSTAAGWHDGHGDQQSTDSDTDDSGSPAAGTPDPTSNPDSRQAHAFVLGTVQSVAGSDVVVTEASGSTVTVVMSATTRYFGAPGSESVAAITPGVTISAVGSSDVAGTVDAVVVFVGVRPGAGDQAPAPGVEGTAAPANQRPGGSTDQGTATDTTSPPPTAPSSTKVPGGSLSRGGPSQWAGSGGASSASSSSSEAASQTIQGNQPAGSASGQGRPWGGSTGQGGGQSTGGGGQG